VFASIDALEFGPDGNIYVLDRGRSCVKVYGPDGSFIRQISREGNGPGEVTSPFAMAVLGDGRISVCSPFQGGIQNFLPDGTWEGLSAEFTNNLHNPEQIYHRIRSYVSTDSGANFPLISELSFH